MTVAPTAGAPRPSVCLAPASFALVLDRLRRAPGGPAIAPDSGPEPCWTPAGARWATPLEEQHRTLSTPSVQLDRIAAVASVDPGPPRQVALGVSSEIALRLCRTEAGVSLVIETAPQRAAMVEQQLPLVVRALRAQGVSVARASVRTVLRPTGAR